MKIKKKLVKEIISVLIRNVGNGRICPHCDKAFIPVDETSKNSLAVYNKLKERMRK